MCGAAGTTDIFTARLPANAGRLWFSAAEAKSAVVASIVLQACQSCGFVENRVFSDRLVDYVGDYDVSLIHSTVFKNFLEQTARRLIDRYDLRSVNIVELGCGRGDFLRQICSRGGNRGFGFDPSLNEASVFQMGEGHISLFPTFFGTADVHIDADFVCALGVLDCIPNPVSFLSTVRTAIGQRIPAVYFEVFNGERALARSASWSIHYESCNYWGPASLETAFARAGYRVLEISACYENDEYLAIEAVPVNATLDSLSHTHEYTAFPTNFQAKHDSDRDNWIAKLEAISNLGGRVAVWGTGGKGTSFLSRVPAALIDVVIDINPRRQGSYTPVSGHRIEAPDALANRDPTLVVVTNPIYLDEVKQALRSMGIRSETQVL